MLKPRLRLAYDQSGLAAVEFALILPVMLTLFFGVYETSQALAARADVVNLTSSAADLVAQSSAPSGADILNAYAAATAILSPFSVTGDRKPTIRVTSIIDDGSGTIDPATGKRGPHVGGLVGWVCTQTGGVNLATAAPAPNAAVTLPQPIMQQANSVIRVEVAYKYVSPTTKSITGPIVMSSTFYSRPRRVLQIATPTGNCNA